MKDSLISELDAALVAASKDIRLLNRLSWESNVEQVFLDGWRKGRPVLPDATQQPQPLNSTVEALETIAGRCDPQHPVGGFLHDSALSYADAGRMLMAVGRPDFTHYSLRLYGRPDRIYRNQGLSPVDVARFFLKLSEELLGNPHLSETVADMPATDFAELLRVEMAVFFLKQVNPRRNPCARPSAFSAVATLVAALSSPRTPSISRACSRSTPFCVSPSAKTGLS